MDLMEKPEQEARVKVIEDLISYLENMAHEDMSGIMPKHAEVSIEVDKKPESEETPADEAKETPEEQKMEEEMGMEKHNPDETPEEMFKKLIKRK